MTTATANVSRTLANHPRREPSRRVPAAVACRTQEAAGAREGADRASATRSRPSAARCRGCAWTRTISSTRRTAGAPLADLFDGRHQLADAALHARPGLGAGLQELLLHGRPHRRHARAPGAARHRLRRRLARAAGRDRALPPAHGLEVPLGVLARHRLQPRLPRQLHRRRDGERQGRLQFRRQAAGRGDARRQRLLEGRRGRRSSTPTRPTAAAWR